MDSDPLHSALMSRSVVRVRDVLAKDPEAATGPLIGEAGFDPPLCFATRIQCDSQIIGLLLRSRAEVNALDSHGRTALAICAAGAERAPLVQSSHPLMSSFHGFCLRLPAEMLPPLPLPEIGLGAILSREEEEQQISVATKLLAAGADPELVDLQGRTPAELASIADRPRLARLCVSYIDMQACLVLDKTLEATSTPTCSSCLSGLPQHVLFQVQEFVLHRHVLDARLSSMAASSGVRSYGPSTSKGLVMGLRATGAEGP